MPLLPNAGSAVVPIEKLRDYALNPEHPVGKHKAKVFKAVLGLTVSDAVFLQEKILEAVLVNNATMTRQDEYGQRYTVEFELIHVILSSVRFCRYANLSCLYFRRLQTNNKQRTTNNEQLHGF